MTVFIVSLSLVFLAEMGDKTQLLVICLAAKYRWQTVLLATFAATLVIFLAASLLGSYLTALIPIYYVKIIASFSFIAFGIWSLKNDKEEECEAGKPGVSPFWAIATAFTVAELGDKTQLATVTLAAKYNSVIPVWFGTTVGECTAIAAGVTVGAIMGKKLPEKAIKWSAAAVFILFGVLGLYESLK